MAHYPLSLDLLPAELLHRVTSFLPCSSILNLCFTNRNLYITCYDRLVFKYNAVAALYEARYHELKELDNIKLENWELQSCHSEASDENSEDEDWYSDIDEEELNAEDDWNYDDWGPTELQRRIAERRNWYQRWPGASVFDNLSAEDSARIALAVERARKLLNVIPIDQIQDWPAMWQKQSFAQWLPHLIALRHDSCLNLRPETLQRLLWLGVPLPDNERPARNPSVPDYVLASFCMVATMLLRLEMVPRPQSFEHHHLDIREPFWDEHPCFNDIVDDLKWKLEEFTYDLRADSTKPTGFNYDVDTYALLLYIIFRTYPFQTMHDTPFPSLHRLPLASTLNNTIPFRTPPDAFTKCQLNVDDMVNYISGQWTGVNTDDHCPTGYEVAPPTRDIRFDASRPSSAYPPDLAVIVNDTSCGTDMYGSFTFGGTASSNGKVSLTKTYPAGYREYSTYNREVTITYKGFITPFGIVGTWEINTGLNRFGRRMVNFEGFFWFWKKEWCDQNWSSYPYVVE